MSNLNDKPITSSEQDKFGFNNLAKKIAAAISNSKNIEGAVLAINGSWGVGKSSLINLIVNEINELNQESDKSEIVISRFNCWWIRGEEALISEFFRQMFGIIKSRSKEKIRKVITGIGSRILLNTSTVLGYISNSIVHGSSDAVTNSLNLIAKSLEQEENLDKLHSELGELLRNGNKRYLVIIDDIDRLLPEESLLIFKLIKTIGRLPNFTYLIAYDRSVAENLIQEKFPVDNPHFLEKIVQIGFDVPHSPRTIIKYEFLKFIEREMSIKNPTDDFQFRHHFVKIMFPRIITPRDLVKICNTLSITWPAVEKEVDYADFIAIEVIRIFYPNLYSVIKNLKHDLVADKIGMAYLPGPIKEVFSTIDKIDSISDEIKYS